VLFQVNRMAGVTVLRTGSFHRKQKLPPEGGNPVYLTMPGTPIRAGMTPQSTTLPS